MFEKAKLWISLIYEKAHEIDRDISVKYFTLRVTWLIGLIISIAVSIFLIIESVVQYYKYDVSTEIRDIYLDNITLPVVTVCSANPMSTASANEFIRKHYLSKYKVNITTSDEFLSLMINKTIKNENDYLVYSTYDREFNQTMRRMFGYDSLIGAFLNDASGVIGNITNEFEK